MKKLIYAGFTFAILLVACKKEINQNNLQPRCALVAPVGPNPNPVPCGSVQTRELLAGQTIHAGTVTISNDPTNLYVTYTTTGGWQIQKTHLYVGDCAAIPVNHSGNPTIGLFPMQSSFAPRVTTCTDTIPLNSLDSCYCVAAHAELVLLGSGGIIQTETGWGQGSPMGGSSWAMVMHYCTQYCTNTPVCEISPGDYRTQTQGGWGASPAGSNPGTYLHAHFAGAFPSGLTVGCTTGNTIHLTSAEAVTSFLPQGGTPAALTQSYIDPSIAINVLAGQVVALTLSVTFDNTYADFGSASGNLSSLVVTTGTFQGWTVAQVLAEANNALGGCTSDYSWAQLNAALTSINENFDNGTIVGTYLSCN